MRTFVAFAVDAAAQQFRTVKIPYGPHGALGLPDVADRLFGSGSSRCYLADWWQPANQLKLICGPYDGVFSGQADFLAMMHGATPSGFRTVACPKDAAIVNQRFLACSRRADGVEVELIADTDDMRLASPGPEQYVLRVVAPLPKIDRVARRRVLQPMLVDLSKVVTNGARVADSARLSAHYPTLVGACAVTKHPSGRSVVSCPAQNGRFVTGADLVAAFHDALPQGFRASTCTQHGSGSTDCARNGRGVELATDAIAWPFSIYAYDASAPDARTPAMRAFLAKGVQAANRNFSAYDPKSAFPIFGNCGKTQVAAKRAYLLCSVRQRTFEDDADYASVVASALPAGYAKATCAIDVNNVMGEDYAGGPCFGSARGIQFEFGSDDAGYWTVWIFAAAR
jgi:hypothetical protein